MKHRTVGTTLLAAALALAPACGKRETVPHLQLVTETCTGTPPLDGVTHLLLRVTGEGIDTPIEELVTDRVLPGDVPAVPAGKARVLEVRGYAGIPGAGRLLSLGRSVPFNVPEDGSGVSVRVFLRRVGSLVPPSTADNPTECVSFEEGARAGHTATLLKDGRVLFAGGFRTEPDGTAVTLSSAEYFDAATGAFTLAPEVPARAFHTATALPNGQVLLAGGERVSADSPVPLRSAALFDPATGNVLETELLAARSHHAAAVDDAGHVLLVGGVGEGGAVVSTAEGFDDQGNGFLVPVALPRVGAAVVPLQGGKVLAVVGGSDGRELRTDVPLFSFQDDTFDLTGEVAALFEPRRDAAVAPFQDAQHLVVAGGYPLATEPDDTTAPLSSGEVLTTGPSTQMDEGPSITGRGDACAVALADGRVLVAGGRRNSEFGGGLHATGQVELLTRATSPTAGVLGMEPLEHPRYLHTCTALPDGTVLIAGGVDDSGGSGRFLDDALIFTPPPQD
jgi:hypothetical protein